LLKKWWIIVFILKTMYIDMKINYWSKFVFSLNIVLREILQKWLKIAQKRSFLTHFNKSPANAFLTPLKSMGYKGAV